MRNDVNIYFNQRKKKAENFAKQLWSLKELQDENNLGLENQINEAKNIVKRYPAMISDERTRKKFLKQNSRVAAYYLCNTIARNLHTEICRQIFVSEIKFPHFYINAVNRGAYKFSPDKFGRFTFSYIQNERAMLEPYYIYKNTRSIYPVDYFEFYKGDFKNNLAITEKFLRSRIKFALVRASGHTFNIINTGQDVICYDTFYNERTGKSIFDVFKMKSSNIKYIYGYNRQIKT